MNLGGPIPFVVAAIALGTLFPLHLNFLFHRPALNRLVHHLYYEIPASNPPPTPRFVGLLGVEGATLSGNGVLISLDCGYTIYFDAQSDTLTVDHYPEDIRRGFRQSLRRLLK